MTNNVSVIDESALVAHLKTGAGRGELVKYMLIETEYTGGSTRNLAGYSIAAGYAVGGQAKGLELTPINDHTGQTVESIKAWHTTIREWITRTPQLAEDGFYLGMWKDEISGNTWVDLTRVFADRADALAEGAQRGELAIYDLSSGTEIRIEQDTALVDAYVLNTTGIAR